MKRLIALVAAAVLLATAPAAGAIPGTGRAPITLHLATPHRASPTRLGAAASRSRSTGYLALDGYAGAKNAADRIAARARNAAGTPRVDRATAGADPPHVALRWKGLHQRGRTPSDSTGAIGDTRYIEVVNSRAAIYDRTGLPIAGAGLRTWWNVGRAASFDPQVIWDPTTDRFYYAGIAVFGDRDNELAFGWSTTDSPDDLATGWCTYAIHYGGELPDYPKLGDSRDFALIGVNAFVGAAFRGADVLAIGKPAAGRTDCPTPGVDPIPFAVGQHLSAGGMPAFTPVPVNQIDTAPTGIVLARSPLFQAADLGLFTVTRADDGRPVIHTRGTTVSVDGYGVPPNAPQGDSPFLLDTLDGRLTQAVSARDPLHGGRIAVWTQHTIAGGAGAIVRWYEIDPRSATVLQTGDAVDGSLFAFNGAIAPDRTGGRFGGGMVLGFNASSDSTSPAIEMVSKPGGSDESPWVLVKASPGPDLDFACVRLGFCRWGDYMAATPDPTASTGGVVWMTGMWTADGRITGDEGTSWRTLNWTASP